MSTRCREAIEHDAQAPAAVPPKIRSSRASRWRTGVLIAVHVAIALHVAHWWRSGTTLSPVEPSDSIEFVKRGIVNAGAVFFAVAILSTLVLGRWFCGWACHIVALQDLCRWILIKLGMRPRPIQLGVLGFVPWLAFAYMFLAPLVQRWMHGDDLTRYELHLLKSDFWAAFPGWPMAAATIVICGFAIVWFLGAKGFCTYGCPYGAIFGVADQFAPMRIRVTDACDGCAHCTAVCTSNVRVHQEVRDWGAVVDPGCMKCLDCVSVCPKDALYVGLGAPALVARPRGEVARKPGELRERVGSTVLLAAFVFATLWVMLDFHGDFEPRLALAVGGISVAVALLFGGKSQRARDYSLGEEATLAVVFVACLFAFRGFVPPGSAEGVPLLCALGISAISAYAIVQLGRMLTRANVSLQRIPLRSQRRTTRAGWLFSAAMLPMLAFAGHGSWQHLERRARAERAAQAGLSYERGVERAQSGDIGAAISEFRRALELDPAFLAARENLAGMLCAAGRFAEGVEQYELALRANPGDADTHALLGQAYLGLQDLALAEEHFSIAVRLRPDHVGAHRALARLCAARGDAAAAALHEAQAQRALEAPRQ